MAYTLDVETGATGAAGGGDLRAVYYKVQWYDERNCAWFDLQKQHPTTEAAAAAYIAGRRCRTMEVTFDSLLEGHFPIGQTMLTF